MLDPILNLHRQSPESLVMPLARPQAELDCREGSFLYFSIMRVAAVTVLMMMHHAVHAKVDTSWIRAICTDEANQYLSHDQEANRVALTIPVTVIIVISISLVSCCSTLNYKPLS